jgi:hypothetical protein
VQQTTTPLKGSAESKNDSSPFKGPGGAAIASLVEWVSALGWVERTAPCLHLAASSSKQVPGASRGQLTGWGSPLS